jgi:hypothetical protein
MDILGGQDLLYLEFIFIEIKNPNKLFKLQLLIASSAFI